MAIYNGKHCVFEQVGLDASELVWNSQFNKDSDNAYNDWNISNMRNTHLPARLLLLSSALQDNLTNTTTQTATNGTNGVLVSTSDKLFLAAEKEMTASPTKARTEESSALTTWNYRTIHTTSNDRIKYDPTNTVKTYWLRSPKSGNTSSAVYVESSGNLDVNLAHSSRRISLCFAF